MSRKAANVTIEQFKALWDHKLNAKYGAEIAGLHDLITDDFDKIGKDISKVKFDWENHGFKTPGKGIDHSLTIDSDPIKIGNLTCYYCYAGGDWEYPVAFIIYLDKDGKTFRGYVPKDGNPWNHDTNEAFGNDDEADSAFLKKWLKKRGEVDLKDEYESDDADIIDDEKAMIEDIITRIEVV